MSREISTISKTMSSLEIAELTGKRHDNVKRDIEKILNALGLDVLKFEDSYLSKQNKKLQCYNLPKRECELLMMGYSVKMRAKVYDRWQELENIELDPIEALERQLVFMKQARAKLANHEDRITTVEQIIHKPKPTRYNINNCGKGYDHLQSYCDQLVAKSMPIAYSALKRFSEFYADELKAQGNCIKTSDFATLVQGIIDNAVSEGAFMMDEQSGIKFKADWLKSN